MYSFRWPFSLSIHDIFTNITKLRRLSNVSIIFKVQPLVHVMEPGYGVSWLTGPWWSWMTKHPSVNKYGYRHDYSSNPYHSSTTWGRGTLKYLNQMRTMNNARADKVILSQTSPPKQESRMLKHYSRAENVNNWLWKWTGMALKSQNSVTLDGICYIGFLYV